MSKSYNGRITKWVWDGNVILHEWVEHFEDVNEDDTVPDNLQSEEAIAAFMQAQLGGRPSNGPPEPGEIPLPTTWLFDPDTFAPASKIVGDKHYSIITDHLGTPLSMFDEAGVQTWGAELDIYGVVKNLQGERNDCPFRYPGQYEDCETGFYYNRFRYYDAESGEYVSQDPIGLASGNPNFYAYTKDSTILFDVFGLDEDSFIGTVYRGMTQTSDGPLVYSGPSGNGNNAANSLGVRPDEKGMSMSTTVEGIQSHRKPPEFGGSQKNSALYKIDTEVLDKYGLKAVKDGETHVSIMVKNGINPDELGERLGKAKNEFMTCSK